MAWETEQVLGFAGDCLPVENYRMSSKGKVAYTECVQKCGG